MKISVITACYNSQAYLASAIESVLKQSYDNIEYILVDGASEDATLEIVRRYTPAFGNRMVLISEQDQGIYDAINKGIARATGDVVGVLHSDDLYASPDVLQHVAEAFNHSLADVVYGDLCYVDPKNLKRVKRHWKSMPFRPGMLHRGWMPAHPSVFVRKSVYERLGPYDEKLTISGDYDYMLRLFSAPISSSYVGEVFTLMRSGGTSNRNLKNLWKKSRQDIVALKKNGLPRPVSTVLLKNIRKLPQVIPGSSLFL